ncbi:MAG: DEAD/DEAH box helicase [Thermogemmata sp.]|nr:DEAD/DEAH box helicase [Thermogemmata sp.]
MLNERNLTASRLAELVIRQIGPESLLLNAETRNNILLALPRPDAERLSRLLQVDGSDDPYTALIGLRFRRGTTQTNILFSFFGCQPPELESDEQLHAPTKAVAGQYPLFDHQMRARRRVYEHLCGQPPRVLLHMPTGAGKTRTTMHIIASYFRERLENDDVIVWLAHTEELCEQAAEEFEHAWQALGDRTVYLFRHFGPYRVDLEAVRGGLLIGGLRLLYRDSLVRQTQFLELSRRTKLVVMDEAHQAVAPTYKHLLHLLAPTDQTAILGLSATPGRSWLNSEEDRKLADFFARRKVTLRVEGYNNPVEYLQREGYLAQVEYVHLPYTPGQDFRLSETELREIKDGLDIPESVLHRLAADHQRNFLILKRAMEEADRGSKILLFACSVEHAQTLTNLLLTKGYKAAVVTGSTPPERRRRLIAQFRDGDEVQILANYGVLTTGFDAPRTNVAIIARPTRSVVLYSQMVGRVSRGPKAGGNPSCRVITVVDQIPGFRSIAESFHYWEDIWTEQQVREGV